MAPQVGFEPTTLRLTAGCSAIELLRNSGGTRDGRADCLSGSTAPRRNSSVLRRRPPVNGPVNATDNGTVHGPVHATDNGTVNPTNRDGCCPLPVLAGGRPCPSLARGSNREGTRTTIATPRRALLGVRVDSRPPERPRRTGKPRSERPPTRRYLARSSRVSATSLDRASDSSDESYGHVGERSATRSHSCSESRCTRYPVIGSAPTTGRPRRHCHVSNRQPARPPNRKACVDISAPASVLCGGDRASPDRRLPRDC